MGGEEDEVEDKYDEVGNEAHAHGEGQNEKGKDSSR